MIEKGKKKYDKVPHQQESHVAIHSTPTRYGKKDINSNKKTKRNTMKTDMKDLLVYCMYKVKDTVEIVCLTTFFYKDTRRKKNKSKK